MSADTDQKGGDPMEPQTPWTPGDTLDPLHGVTPCHPMGERDPMAVMISGLGAQS